VHERVRILRSGPDLEIALFELREDAIESFAEFEAELDGVESGAAHTVTSCLASLRIIFSIIGRR
jgi:hypothetical protein